MKKKKKYGKYTKGILKPVKEEMLFVDTYPKVSSSSDLGSVKIYIGEVSKALSMLDENSIDCVITSPPYWRQRDYKDPRQIGQENSYFEYIERLAGIFNGIRRVLKSTGTFFLNIGYKYLEKELLLIPELLAIELQKSGWALLNKIIWHKPNAMPSSLDNRFSNTYEPVFLFVKKESKYKYYLSLDNLRLPVSNFTSNREPEEILGLDVENSLNKSKNIKGKVTKVFKNDKGDIFAQVEWEDGKKTYELVNDFNRESQLEVVLICEKCGEKIIHEVDIDKHHSLFCREWLKPILPPVPDFNKRVELKPSLLFNIPFSRTSYKGKYKVSPENRGASPGARKSLFGEYLVVQRRYRIFQPLIADYLRFWREKRGIPTKEIDRLLGYRDTAGHWFRKDTGSWGRGGAIPLPEDWFRLKEILRFNEIYDRWVTETHLVLQTVRAHPKGRNPGDVWNIKTQQLPEAHFAVFPEELVRKCIEAGCPSGGVVLDPFAGSGTTGKVAQDLGRNAILIELIPDYVEIIKRRCKKIEEIIYVE